MLPRQGASVAPVGLLSGPPSASSGAQSKLFTQASPVGCARTPELESDWLSVATAFGTVYFFAFSASRAAFSLAAFDLTASFCFLSRCLDFGDLSPMDCLRESDVCADIIPVP